MKEKFEDAYRTAVLEKGPVKPPKEALPSVKKEDVDLIVRSITAFLHFVSQQGSSNGEKHRAESLSESLLLQHDVLKVSWTCL